jgi:hypothetical protein
MSNELPNERADLANLRLEVSALSSKMNVASLPAQLKSVRRTIQWSAAGIAVALVLSGVLHTCGTAKIEKLEQRLDKLETKAP